MGMMSVSKPKPPKPVSPMLFQLETVEVPRAWIRDHGWVHRYDDLAARADAGEPGVVKSCQARGEIVMQSYAALDRAWFREGSQGQACLYVQAWVGPA